MRQAERSQLESLSNLSCALYSARSADEFSNAVLGLLPTLVPHDKSFLTLEPIVEGRRARRVNRSLTMGQEQIDLYDQRFARDDYTAWYRNLPDASVYRDSDLVTTEHMESSVIFREWIAPMGMRFVCGTVLRRDGRRVADLTLFRSEDHGDFSDDDLFLLGLATRQMEAWLSRERPLVSRGVATESTSAPARDEGSDSGFRKVPNGFETVLTPRELEVARLAMSELTLRQMADALSISYGTVRRHMANIYRKLGVTSRVQLMGVLSKG